MPDPLTKEEIEDLADRWYRALDVHAPVEELHAMMLDEGNVMEWPEGPTHGHAEFTGWYEKVIRRFFDEVHTLKSVERNGVSGGKKRKTQRNASPASSPGTARGTSTR